MGWRLADIGLSGTAARADALDASAESTWEHGRSMNDDTPTNQTLRMECLRLALDVFDASSRNMWPIITPYDLCETALIFTRFVQGAETREQLEGGVFDPLADAPPDPIETGTEFPPNPKEFALFMRTDMVPNRVFQFHDGSWKYAGPPEA